MPTVPFIPSYIWRSFNNGVEIDSTWRTLIQNYISELMEHTRLNNNEKQSPYDSDITFPESQEYSHAKALSVSHTDTRCSDTHISISHDALTQHEKRCLYEALLDPPREMAMHLFTIIQKDALFVDLPGEYIGDIDINLLETTTLRRLQKCFPSWIIHGRRKRNYFQAFLQINQQ